MLALTRYDMMHELREVTSTPTPLGEFLRNPVLLTTLMGHRKKARRGGEPQKREKEKDSDTASILTLVLAEKERQAHHLKAILRSTGERLEYEIRRADQAETRTRSADDLARTSSTRVTAAETGRHQAELDAARAREEIKRYQILAETAERELRRAETDALRAERLRSNAEQSAADAKDIARKAQQSLREQQAREEGREEGRRLEVRRRYNDGREDGFEDGCAQGYEAGHTEGLEAGRAEGYADRRGRMPLDRHASPRDGGTFRVRRRAHAALGEDREPWLQGGNVALGYWENARTTTQTSISGGCRGPFRADAAGQQL
ncbi:hypothetical protein B0H21DRAFT_865662 [Amylocystis lapponica]|nr:hypothetical protein B0H21DRAFT_865662 [Amylocystis lapponica]